MDIHDYGKRLDQAAVCLAKDEAVSVKNKEIIEKFHRHLVIGGYSKARIVKYVGTARRVVK